MTSTRAFLDSTLSLMNAEGALVSGRLPCSQALDDYCPHGVAHYLEGLPARGNAQDLNLRGHSQWAYALVVFPARCRIGYAPLGHKFYLSSFRCRQSLHTEL